MAKFINLTERKTGTVFTLNIGAIEYMRPSPNGDGTELITHTHHTKYTVRESIGHICEKLVDNGILIIDAQETPPIVEVE